MSLIPDLQPIDAKIGDGLASILQMKGPRQAPAKIDMAEVMPVWNLGQNGFAGMIPVAGQFTASAINGVSNQSKEMVAPNGISGVIVPASSFNCRIQGCYANVSFDAAGALAFNGKRIAVFWSLFGVVDNFQVDLGGIIDTVATAQLAYRLWPTGWVNPAWIVPDSYRLRATVICLDGTVFPANTTWNSGVTGFKQALHGQLPL